MHRLTDALVDFLKSEAARDALARLAEQGVDPSNELSWVETLRERFTREETAALLDQANLRARALSKFPGLNGLLFTEEALEQATGWEVARYRAERFATYETVADLGAGIGGDALALAARGGNLFAFEKDWIRSRLCRHNLETLRLSSTVQVVCGNWTQLRVGTEAAFADPDRRRGGRRQLGLETMSPPLSAFQDLLERVPHLAIKVAPSLPHEKIPAEAEAEFLSHRGVCKEAVLLFGGTRRGVARQATILPGRHTLTTRDPVSSEAVGPPGLVLYEPDAAVIRAGLVLQLAHRLGARRIDERIAYLTSEEEKGSVFARAWRVLRHGPFHKKTLDRWLAVLGTGRVIVKKRGSRIDPTAFQKNLKTRGSGPTHTVFLTRHREAPWMIVGV